MGSEIRWEFVEVRFRNRLGNAQHFFPHRARLFGFDHAASLAATFGGFGTSRRSCAHDGWNYSGECLRCLRPAYPHSEALFYLFPRGWASPHYSRRLLLQPSIRRCDKPDGGRARRSVGQHTVQVCFPSSRLRAPVSRGVSAVSSRTLVNNAG
jgi:hypothetical protein